MLALESLLAHGSPPGVDRSPVSIRTRTAGTARLRCRRSGHGGQVHKEMDRRRHADRRLSVVGKLYRRDTITPERTALVVNREVGIRQMLKHDYPPKPNVYGRKKEKRGYALRALRPVFPARAGSGRELEIAAAQVATAAEWPPSLALGLIEQ